jgi:hypothetical protein
LESKLDLIVAVTLSALCSGFCLHVRSSDTRPTTTRAQSITFCCQQAEKKNNSILKLPTKEWHGKSDHSQRPPSRPPKRRGSGHWAEAVCTVCLPMSG